MTAARVTVGVLRLEDAADLPLPNYMSEGAAGADVCAAVREPLVLQPGERALVPTGIILAVPDGYEVQVRPRSGLALRNGLTLLNSPGTIDADYRGPLGILMINLSAEPQTVRRGDRIAQLIVAPVVRGAFLEVSAHAETTRGAGGFGSTGVGDGPSAVRS